MQGPWEEQEKFWPDPVVNNDSFGISVGLMEDQVLVGNSYEDGQMRGSVSRFEKESGDWESQTKLIGDPSDYLGAAIAVSGNRAVFGAPANNADKGAVYLYELVGGQWSTAVKLQASDGAYNHWFGTSVGLSEDWILVGAPYAKNASEVKTGAAYLFQTREATCVPTGM